jgi:N-methylhydantoinase B
VSSPDPVTLGIMWDRLNAITSEMTAALIRTSFSTIVRESHDLSVVLFDASARALAQGSLSAPGHSGTAAHTVRYILRTFPAAGMRPGDVYITNDPWYGTGHVFDMNFVRPVFRGDRLIGFTFSDTHVPDMGGLGFSADIADKFAEGLHVPAVRMMRGGELDPTLMAIVRSNVRVPEQVIGDFMANVTCNELGDRLLQEFLDEYGLQDLEAVGSAIVSKSDSAMREAIRRIPDGTYSNRMRVEGVDRALTLACTCTVRDSSIHVDFDGTDGIVAAAINVPFSYTRAMAIFALRLLTVPSLPANEGSIGPLTFSAPDNCVLNALPPTPTAGRHVVGHYVTPLVMGAFAQVLPERVQAECGMIDLVNIQGRPAGGRPMSNLYFAAGGYGAMSGMDGLSALATPASIKVTPVEVWEHASGIAIESKRLIPDSGGAGAFRGGLGQEIVLRNDLDFPLTCSFFGRQSEFAPRGVGGGGPGRAHRYEIEGVGVDPIGRSTLGTDQRLTIALPGGGGYGDPRERDPQRVLRDVQDGFVTIEAARRDYGVDVDPGQGTAVRRGGAND